MNWIVDNGTLVGVAVLACLAAVAAFYRLARRGRVVRRERDASVQSLRESEGRFHTLADSIPQLAWTAHADGHIFWYNRRWYEYTGKTESEMEGWGWQSVHDPEELPKVLERWKGSIASGEPFDMVFPLRGADGRFRPFLTRVMPLKDARGRVLQWFGTNTDITEQREMAAALLEADRRKDEFLAVLAHELRNPLAPIRTGLQVMRVAKGDDRAVEDVRRMMERQVAQMVRLLDDLLDISRITRDKIELRKEHVELASVVGSAVETSQPLIEGLGHAFTVTLPPEPVYLDADGTRMAQVLANLLDNAAKYTPPGGNVRLLTETTPGGVEITVEDDGVGIPEAMLSRVFDLFARVDRALERSQGGLGIGLTLVKRLVEMHGGTVEARSGGRGSAFVVRLPTVAVPPAVPASRSFADRPRTQRRILVVDDNADSADSLSLLLGVMDNEVRTAYDGLAGVEAAEAFRPDVILLDIGMPVLNGFDACRRIREYPWGKAIFIIAQTGWGQEEDRRRSREAGFDKHLVKPIDPAALGRLLESGREEPAPR